MFIGPKFINEEWVITWNVPGSRGYLRYPFGTKDEALEWKAKQEAKNRDAQESSREE